MATDGISPVLAIRSNTGVELWSSAGLKVPYTPDEKFIRDESKLCRAIAFSPDGRFLAWANGTKIQICSTNDWKILSSIPRPKAYYLKFSPNGTYLMSWEMFTTSKDVPEGAPNLYVYQSATGVEMFSTIQKKNVDWEPSWSNDESIMAVMCGGEALFYEINSNDGFTKSKQKMGGGRNGILSVGPASNSPYIAFYIPGGTKSTPSMCKLYKYPDIHAAQPIGCKSFFQSDRVELMWNKRGTGLILLTSTEVDQSGASYYGKQALHFMSSKGDSFAVHLNKDGPIHAVSWNPNSTEFCVIYGFMPANASFFNLKCDATFQFGEGARNSIYYNGFGNLVILAGFGNLNGNVEVWDVAKRKQITTFRAPDTTLLEWCANGENFVTATTAPRLRMSNGFKIWHYSGALLHETLWPTGQELLEVVWQQFPPGTYNEKPITNVKIEGIKSSQPQASAQVYRPPNARGIIIDPISTASPSTAEGDNRNVPTSAGGSIIFKSKKSERSYKRAQNYFKKKKESTPSGGGGGGGSGRGSSSSSSNNNNGGNSGNHNNNNNNNNNSCAASGTGAGATKNGIVSGAESNSTPTSSNNATSTTISGKSSEMSEDMERMKRVRLVNRKLNAISKLKFKQEQGDHLEANQLQKITMESALIDELKALKIP